MWSNSDGNEIKKIIKRINKISLSNSAENLFLNTLMSYSYLPKNITDNEFLDIKIDWLIKNKKDDLLELFLNKNENFYNKEKIIHYLVDKNIAKANLKDGCKKVNFISKEIKDSYLEKFKIYCLIFDNKKRQANLLYDILKEQKLSDEFFDKKINYLLGVSDKNDDKIRDDNLLNFYLSSITVSNFKYEPNDKTKKIIWEYLNSADLIKLENIEDKEKIINLEIAANKNTFDKVKIFDIYRKIPFDLNFLINAENTFQSLDGTESRALIYQKYLLSDKVENKIKLLFILKDLFEKDKLANIFTEFLSERLKEFDLNDIPDSYRETVERNIVSNFEYKLGRIKFDDKILHKSRVIRYYSEPGTAKQKTQKDLNNVYKKIKRNKKYFFSAKDLVLIETLEADGFDIPKDIDYENIAKKYSVPNNLLSLVTNEEIGFLALKFVEIIGADELADLDPETIYFITHILNKAKLTKFRNQVLISALPLRQ
tara:strand:- start:341 stop:1792 length:1452 start_codon:yes stop_codon:yes gene_type:complete